MAVTFKVSSTTPSRTLLRAEPLAAALGGLAGAPVEACGAAVAQVVPVEFNALLASLWQAFAGHFPLVLGPNTVWLAIAQGFAAHMRGHAERLRGRFVSHSGKLTLSVRRDDFVKGSASNDWPAVFADLSQQIAGHVGRRRDLVVCDFSTTGPVARAASELVLLDAMQQYFDYEVCTLCGIPEITLTGSVADWVRLRDKARALAEYDLEWWIGSLVPVLDEFVAAAEGRPASDFWAHIFKHESFSGSEHLFGWMQVFFPYLVDLGAGGRLMENPTLRRAHDRGGPRRGGIARWMTDEVLSLDSVPLGLSRAPLQWQYYEERHAMELLGGFAGIAQDPATFAVRPVIAWGVRDARGSGPLIRTVHASRSLAPTSVRAAGPTVEVVAVPVTPEGGVYLTVGGARCSRPGVANGRLHLAADGLYFIPDAARKAAGSEFEVTVEGGDDDSDVVAEVVQLGSLDAFYIAAEALGEVTLTTEPVGAPTLTPTLIAFALPGGESLRFLLPVHVLHLDEWFSAIGRPWQHHRVEPGALPRSLRRDRGEG